jgi:PEP-CTERM/exosortase A-associated glycosyltransferase
MTRVLHILDHSLPLHSGYTFRTRAIMKAQIAEGLDVRGITGPRHSQPGASTENADGLTFHRTPGKPAGPAGLREWREVGAHAQAIVALARDEWRPDLLHAHSPALAGMAGLKAARALGLPLVYEIRAFWEDAAVGNGTGRAGSIRYRLTRELENRVIAGADAVVTICEGLRGDLIARGFAPERIGVMPNGVDLTLFGEAIVRDGALAQQLELGEGPVIGFIGSFYDYEGLDDLISAMPGLIAGHPDARLLLVGGGPKEAALRSQAQVSSAANAIRFIGRVPHGEVKRYYSLCDVMAYPRKRSRLTDLVTPLKPLEAMAQGRLVAASDVGGHRELVSDGATGILFPPDDPNGCAAALSSLFGRRDEWARLREAARAQVANNHDWERNILRYQAIYHPLLSAGPRYRSAA